MLFLAVLAAAAASTVPSPATSAKPLTLQQKFDAASNLAAEEKCTEALPLFEELQHDARVKPGSIPAAAIAVRKGVCLIQANRPDEGEMAIAAGLPVLEKAGQGFDGDVSNARIALGNAAYTRSDYARAAEYFRLALENRTGVARLTTLGRLAKATAFDGDEAALKPTEEALQILSAEPKPNKMALASFHTLHARTLLNQGKAQDAYKELKDALSLSGGLTSRTSLAEVSLRSDLAMAAMQTGHKDDARLYLAYTGAGRIQESPFTRAKSMSPPLCGSETGLRPDDVAVVEFGIGEDGYVINAHTIYSRGGPQVAAAFEQAVEQWVWDPQNIAKIPAFYRLLTRIELRCSTAMGNRPGLFRPFDSRFKTWAVQQLPIGALEGDDRQSTARVRAALGDSSTAPIVRIAALGVLADSEVTATAADRIAMLDQAITLATNTQIPAHAVNWLRASRMILAKVKSESGRRTLYQSAAAMAIEPAFAQDPLAADTLKMFAAGGSERHHLPQSDTLLTEVARDERLEANHPLRQLAWLTLANRAAMAGDMASAQADFQRTGLTEEQCALLSLPPAVRRTNVDGGDYPMTAAMMGFEGWVQLEYDIAADGNTANVRPIVAYPAMIFVDAAKAIGRNIKYEWSYRPGGATACSANTQTITFRR